MIVKKENFKAEIIFNVKCPYNNQPDIGTTRGGTANEIFQKVNSVFTTSGISWQQCIGLSTDNTVVNMGIRNSIKARVLKENSSVYIMHESLFS